jgi:hypothetical protein
MAQGMTRRSVGRNNDGSEGVDKMQTLPRLKPTSSCCRREQRIDGSPAFAGTAAPTKYRPLRVGNAGGWLATAGAE